MLNRIKFLSQKDVEKCLDMTSTIEAMKTAFAELSAGNTRAPLRTGFQFETNDSGALFMPVYFPAKKLVGLKSVMIHKDNPAKDLPMIQAMYNVFNSENGQPLAIMDGEYLTSMRTGAASGLATELLSREDSKVAVIFGAGVQAEKQIEAICKVRTLKNIYISDLNEDRIDNLITKLQPHYSAEFKILEDSKYLKEADIICTATSSSKPVFKHSDINESVHINGIGSYRPDMCEIPHETICNSQLIVDSIEACLSEAGDILQPIEKGLIDSTHIHAEIGEIVNGSKEGRKSQNQISVFKSVGNAVQDIAAASIVLNNANKLNIGTELTL